MKKCQNLPQLTLLQKELLMNNSVILSDVKTKNLTTMTTKELANFLKTSPKVILENAKKMFA
jgi:hypothetical protein